MYYYLHGLVTFHTKDEIIIECAGVGYDVIVPHVDEFPIGENLFVFVSYIHSENDEYFVGFKTIEELKMYNALTSVKGIGPKTALNALSSTSVGRLSQAIDNAEEVFLMRLPGIGKKNASQIILDLRGKLTLLDNSATTLNKEMDAAKEGLKNLGFKEKEIKGALLSINDNNLSADEYLKKALTYLQKK